MPPKGQTYAEFPTVGQPTTRYLLDAIPLTLWQAVRARAQTEHRSVRHVLLTLLRTWIADDSPRDHESA